MINQVTLVGRLTKEPELKWTTEDRAVLNLTLALNRFGKIKELIMMLTLFNVLFGVKEQKPLQSSVLKDN